MSKRLHILLYLLVCVFLQNAHAAYVYGRYEGDGNPTQSITGLGFQPEVILVKGSGLQTAWIATSTMDAGDAKLLNVETAPQTGIISSIDADGFTVANSSNSNSSGVDYFFVAWDDADGNIELGSFTPEPDSYDPTSTYSSGTTVEFSGSYYTSNAWINAGETPTTHSGKWDLITLNNPVSGNTINLGYEPFMVWSITEGDAWFSNSHAQFIMDNVDSTDSKAFNLGTSLGSNEEIVEAITSTGFEFATPADPGVNSGTIKGVEYHYIAFHPNGIADFGTYTGNDVSGTKIATSVELDFVFVVNQAGGQNPWWKTAAMGPDTSYKFTDVSTGINILEFESDGFTLGTGGETNKAPATMEFFGLSGGTLLPVEWLHFYGRPTVDGDYLSWSTASEINTDYFEIQISYDGFNFETVGYTSAQGNSVVKTSYDYLHASAINEVRYYRLKQADLDGKFDFSKIIVIQPGGYSDISLFPNPANNQFFIHSDNPILSIEVYNIIGEIIYADYDFNEVSSQYNSEVLIKNWSSGTYHVVVQNSFSRISKRLIIK